MNEISATVRLQFHRGFTLNDAVPLVTYFARLGISHIYASPLLKARSGSMHGYDVVDPTCINPELGGEEALERLVAELRKHDMGLLVDFVSNHMAVGGEDNPWWMDVMEWGLLSPYAQFFDIQWNSPDPLLKGQLLLPFLRTDYGEVLASGEITLHFDPQQGTFYAQHFDHRFPIYPPSYGQILRNTGHNSLLAFVHPFEALERDPNHCNAAKKLQHELSDAAKNQDVIDAIEHALTRYQIEKGSTENNASESATTGFTTETLNARIQSDENIQRLHRLLEHQHYRLASWRTAADDINWRRFFDVNELGGLRVERAEVFEATHAKVFELIAKGLIDGLRIDHVDGLANPRSYCRKLRRRLDNLRSLRPAGLEQDHLPIYVEKILGDGEKLSQNWTVDGTTGYEFMNQISLLQHDPVGELQLFALWSEISGRHGTFKEEVLDARRLVLAGGLNGDFEMVAQGLLLIARTDISTRDLTLAAIRRALFELVVHFPVYRTYSRSCGRSEQDKRFFTQALNGARTTLAEADWPLLEHLDRWLGGQHLHELPPGPARKQRQKTLARFQQLTSPAAAKAVEDTACYRSATLLSRNDVGFDPQHFSAPLTQFHEQCKTRATEFPDNLLATATHDHKRGEDTRARMAVISERSVWFAERVQNWRAQASPFRVELPDGVAPSPGDELMLYQTLLSSWPLELDITERRKLNDHQASLQAYFDRIWRWQEKALREAKLRTAWSAPNSAYETACKEFLTKLLLDDEGLALRTDIAAAAFSLAPAGALNGLSQTLLRMTVPGLPDLYQGNEFWDFSLVDPDNREPVDFKTRTTTLSQLSATGDTAQLRPQLLDQWLNQSLVQWKNGFVKQWLIAQTLTFRSAHAELFRRGDYEPLQLEGEKAEHLVAFVRHYRNEYIIAVVPRLAAALLGDASKPHIPSATWSNTVVVLPSALHEGSFISALTNTTIRPADGRLAIGEILGSFPVNLLHFTSL